MMCLMRRVPILVMTSRGDTDPPWEREGYQAPRTRSGREKPPAETRRFQKGTLGTWTTTRRVSSSLGIGTIQTGSTTIRYCRSTSIATRPKSTCTSKTAISICRHLLAYANTGGGSPGTCCTNDGLHGREPGTYRRSQH